jgi:COMPASS component SPP1
VSYTASGRLSKSTASANTKASGSRSGSTVPPAEEDIKEADADEDKENDDKVYCICRSHYEEGRVMIACDRCVSQLFALCQYSKTYSCDDWYHMSCLGMPDLEVDLVDQFFCPVCVESEYSMDLPICNS